MDPQDPGHEYIDRMREEGYTDLEITEALRDAGWTDEQIRRALAPDEDGRAPPPPDEPPPDRDRREKRAPIRSKSDDGTAVWLIVVVGCLGMIVIVGAILAAIMFPVFARARVSARMAACMSNLQQIGRAHRMYTQDHSDALPPAQRWPDRLQPYLNSNEIYSCPSDQRTSPPTWQGNTISYTLNGAVSGLSVKAMQRPNAVPLSYDGLSPVGSAGAAAFRHNEGASCAYVDGHVKWVRDSDWKSKWTAPAVGPAPAPPPPPERQPARPDQAPTGPEPTPSEPKAEMTPREKARSSACQSNLKQVSLEMLMYVADYDDAAPPADRWPEVLDTYIHNTQIYICPSDDDPHPSELEGWEIS